MNISELHAEVC